MNKDKRSFFERITGAVKITESEELYAIDESGDDEEEGFINEPELASEGELAVDVYQNPDQITIKTMVAGVRPEDLDISITRDMVVIKGRREEERNIKEDDYLVKEIYWGTFSRTIVLPQEIDVEEAEAIEKHGLLIIRLPKIDKGRQTKLKVKSNA